jgi:hypothetical protein
MANTFKSGGLIALIQLLITGLGKTIPSSLKQITIQGKTYTPPQLVQLLNKYLDAVTAVTQAKAALQAVAAERKAQEASIRLIVQGLVAYIRLQLGHDPTALAQFGLTAHQKAKPTSHKQAAAVDKRNAKRQRKTAALAQADAAPQAAPATNASQAAPAASSEPPANPAPAVTPAAAAGQGGK